MNTKTSALIAALLACVLMAPGSAGAEEDEAVARIATPALPALGRTLEDEVLARHRGGQQDLYMNDIRERASITNTSTSNLQTGTNIISEGAFSQSNGLPIAIQNSGNNVVIQNSTILNLQLK